MKTSLPKLTRSFLLLASCICLMAPAVLAQNHLLLTEVTLAPDSAEFVEIYNPTMNSISLDNYFLADNAEYALIASGTTNVINSDFIVQFPAGYNILPNQVIVVAIKGDYFTAYYGSGPDFEVVSQSASIPDMLPINVGVSPTLTNTGEGIILFYWSGTTDLVSDVDMVNAGTPTIANKIASKTGISVNASTYLTDAGTMPLQMSTPGIGFSTKRIMLEGNNEILTGGNGITGNDETSENILVTWDSAYSAPTPGFIDFTTGIKSINFLDKINVFPNPSGGVLFIDFGGLNYMVQMEIYNILGESVYSNFISPSKSPVEIKLNRITPGIYFLQMNNGEKRTVRKIIVN